ncbi:MAG TPA: hypothetical protein VKR32_07975 [Puia sp.]|nr:hypothetical protein [Puia sp.]
MHLFLVAQIIMSMTINFQGTWHVNPDKSPNADAGAPKIQIRQTADSIFIDRTDMEGKSFSEHLSFDGKIFVSYTTSKRRKSGTAKWDNDDKSSFTETAVLGSPDKPDEVAFKVSEQWSISPDGNELTENITLTKTGGQPYNATVVYDKEK